MHVDCAATFRWAPPTRPAARRGLTRPARHAEDDFLLEVFTRVPPPARSVAQGVQLA
jgi:hypothetical protein